MIDMTLDKVHNEVAAAMLRQIVKQPIEAGGDLTDSLMILESLVLGVLILAQRKRWDVDLLLAELTKRVKERLLLAGPAQGTA